MPKRPKRKKKAKKTKGGKPAGKGAGAKRAKKKSSSGQRPKCGLCGKTGRLVKTECCGNYVCDDEHEYVMFSYARNSCSRNHSRYTLCGFHFNEGHEGRWQDCKECRDEFETEDYVEYGTNEHNFEKLKDPPKFEPTKCDGCGEAIVRADGGYSQGADGIFCFKCTRKRFPDLPC